MSFEKQAQFDIFHKLCSRLQTKKLPASDAIDPEAGVKSTGEAAPMSDSQTHLRRLFDLSQSQPAPGRLSWSGSVCSRRLARQSGTVTPQSQAPRDRRPAASVLPSPRPAPGVLPSPQISPGGSAGLVPRLNGVVASKSLNRAAKDCWQLFGDPETCERTDPLSIQSPIAAVPVSTRSRKPRSAGPDAPEEFLFRPSAGGAASPRRLEDEAPRFNLSDGFTFEEDSPADGGAGLAPAQGRRDGGPSDGASDRMRHSSFPAGDTGTTSSQDGRKASPARSVSPPERPQYSSHLPSRSVDSPRRQHLTSTFGRTLRPSCDIDDGDSAGRPGPSPADRRSLEHRRSGEGGTSRPGEAAAASARHTRRVSLTPSSSSIFSPPSERPLFDLMSFTEDSPVRAAGDSVRGAGHRGTPANRQCRRAGSEDRTYGTEPCRPTAGDTADICAGYSDRCSKTDPKSEHSSGRAWQRMNLPTLKDYLGSDNKSPSPTHISRRASEHNRRAVGECNRTTLNENDANLSERMRYKNPRVSFRHQSLQNYEDDANTGLRHNRESGHTGSPGHDENLPNDQHHSGLPDFLSRPDQLDDRGAFHLQDSHKSPEDDPWDPSDFRLNVHTDLQSDDAPWSRFDSGDRAPSSPPSFGQTEDHSRPASYVSNGFTVPRRSPEQRRDSAYQSPPPADSEPPYRPPPPAPDPAPSLPGGPTRRSPPAARDQASPLPGNATRRSPPAARDPAPPPPGGATRRSPPAARDPAPPPPGGATRRSPPAAPGPWRPEGAQSDLRSVAELPARYRPVFRQFPYFNIVQSTVMDDALYSDRPLVVCAPTGSGKTVVFELAIIQLLMEYEEADKPVDCIIVYMAPMKAICAERYQDWSQKFTPLGLQCGELTGDSDGNDYTDLQRLQVVLTTPEKWDSVTRRWADMRRLLRSVRLLLIDEVHLLNDPHRGPTMEAVISRMKNANDVDCGDDAVGDAGRIKQTRFLAISATIPNAEDIGEWLGTELCPAITHKLDESLRPVRLRRVVLGYPCPERWSPFRFDLSLNYKLAAVLHTYSEQKPALVFCSTRKGCQQAASVVEREACLVASAEHKVRLTRAANLVTDSALRDHLLKGVGVHHAGLLLQDRRAVESLFLSGDLPLLICTSTLAMGVNLPAHLVVVKSTRHYTAAGCQPYTDSEILQMVGRAGRPQFESSATAVIMTEANCRHRYEQLLSGSQLTESCLHRHLIGHINAEVVLGTITDVEVALRWLQSTFLYVRVLRNPTHYGVPAELSRRQVEDHLQDLCMVELGRLSEAGLIQKGELEVAPTPSGRLMARFCISFETMRALQQLSGEEDLPALLAVLSGCGEFEGLQLRTSDKRCLNALNRDPNRTTIRHPLPGRVKTTQMKVNCLIQATLGSISIGDPSLSQDVTKIFRVAERVMRCATEHLCGRGRYRAYLSSVLLAKSVRARLWPDSEYASRQLSGVGPALSTALVNAGITSLQGLVDAGGRRLELILNRLPPFGTHLCEAARRLPHYSLTVAQTGPPAASTAAVTVTVALLPPEFTVEQSTAGARHSCLLIVGDQDNQLLCAARVTDGCLQRSGCLRRQLSVRRAAAGDRLTVSYISEHWVGLDEQTEFSPTYRSRPVAQFPTPAARGAEHAWQEEAAFMEHAMRGQTAPLTPGVRHCRHLCLDKASCAHACCKQGVTLRPPAQERVSQLIHGTAAPGEPGRGPPVAASQGRGTLGVATPGRGPPGAATAGRGPPGAANQGRGPPGAATPGRGPPRAAVPRGYSAATPGGGPLSTAAGPDRSVPGAGQAATRLLAPPTPLRGAGPGSRLPGLPVPDPTLPAPRTRAPRAAGPRLPGPRLAGPTPPSAGGSGAGGPPVRPSGLKRQHSPAARHLQDSADQTPGSSVFTPPPFTPGGVRQNRTITEYFPVRKAARLAQVPVCGTHPAGCQPEDPQTTGRAADPAGPCSRTPGPAGAPLGPTERPSAGRFPEPARGAFSLSDPAWEPAGPAASPPAAGEQEPGPEQEPEQEPEPGPEPAAARSVLQVAEFERRRRADRLMMDRLYGDRPADSVSGPERHPSTSAVSPTGPRAPGPSWGPREAAAAPGTSSGPAPGPARRRSIFSSSATLDTLRQGRQEPVWALRAARAPGPAAI